MDYEIAEIEQHPARIAAALDMAQGGTLFRQRLVYLIAKGLYLTFCLAATYNKIIGEIRYPADVKHHDVISLLIRGDLYGLAGLL